MYILLFIYFNITVIVCELQSSYLLTVFDLPALFGRLVAELNIAV